MIKKLKFRAHKMANAIATIKLVLETRETPEEKLAMIKETLDIYFKEVGEAPFKNSSGEPFPDSSSA